MYVCMPMAEATAFAYGAGSGSCFWQRPAPSEPPLVVAAAVTVPPKQGEQHI